jgi:oligosaccharide repeat unit polymerase
MVAAKMVAARSTSRQAGRASQMGAATVAFVVGVGVTALTMPANSAAATFQYAAVGVALSLGISLLMEMQSGLRSMLRADLIMLITLFGLTFVEFLVPQKEMFDFMASPQGAVNATLAVMTAFVGIVIGRHLVSESRKPVRAGPSLDLPPKTMFTLFLLAFTFGYLHIFLAVSFDVLEAMRQMALPRFSQSWGRGRLGGWADLLVEVGALIYLIPPLTGVMLAQASRYTMAQKAITAILFLFTLYYGFSGGTRNVFGVYMLTFCGAYLAMKPKITLKELLFFIGPAGAVTLIGMYFMLEFRTVGLGSYSFSESEFDGVFVDSNMVVIAKLTEVFPKSHDYLGLEIPYIAAIKPIPRAIWSGKPEGLSLGMEEALGVEGLTLASTFVGEAYMAGGLFAVLIAGLAFGAGAAKWNQMGRNLSSNYNLILYVSGFFCAAISMRSILSMAPTVLPTVGLWTYGKLFLNKKR